MKNDMTGFALGALGVVAFNLGFSTGAGKHPDDYIPLWTSQDGGDISMMINTDEIARIVPVSPDLLSKEDDGYIEVHFSDGKMYKVYEDFDEFMSRVRSSRR